METDALVKELLQLRDRYVTSTPRQRLKVILDRIDNPWAYPNLLVTRVAAIEALARALIMDAECKTKAVKRERYSKYKKREPHTLVEDFLKRKLKGPAREYFGEETWSKFKVAIGYRNLLAHECTFLGNQKFVPLEDACEQVLTRLVELARLKRNAT